MTKLGRLDLASGSVAYFIEKIRPKMGVPPLFPKILHVGVFSLYTTVPASTSVSPINEVAFRGHCYNTVCYFHANLADVGRLNSVCVICISNVCLSVSLYDYYC